MSESDPYAERKKNVESTAADRDMNDNPDAGSGQGRRPEDDINPVQPKTMMPGNQKNQQEMDEDEDSGTDSKM